MASFFVAPFFEQRVHVRGDQLFFPSGQKCRLSSSSPAFFEGSEQGLALMTKAKARELLALRDGALPSQFAPAGPVQLGSALFQQLSMGRVLLPPGGVGDRAPVA